LNKKKNSGTFKSGHKKFAGRQRGTLNKKTMILKAAGINSISDFKNMCYESLEYFLNHESEIVRFQATKEISKYLFAIREH
jgi:hypothetical protein